MKIQEISTMCRCISRNPQEFQFSVRRIDGIKKRMLEHKKVSGEDILYCAKTLSIRCPDRVRKYPDVRCSTGDDALNDLIIQVFMRMIGDVRC